MDRPPVSPKARLASLDQFRGYTVAAMFLVNFLGRYHATPDLLQHHNTWCSYADTVMPQFFFAVGMALRLVLLREAETHGTVQALIRGARRGVILMLVGFVWYQPGHGFASWASLSGASPWEIFRDAFLTNAFQALTHIGAATLWVLPVITRGVGLRVGFALLSAGLHLWVSQAGWTVDPAGRSSVPPPGPAHYRPSAGPGGTGRGPASSAARRSNQGSP